MNSLNIVSRLTTARTGNTAQDGGNNSSTTAQPETVLSEKHEEKTEDGSAYDDDSADIKPDPSTPDPATDEKTPLLPSTTQEKSTHRGSWTLPRRIAQAVLRSVQVVITTITAPGRYILACFYDEQGSFSAILPLRNLTNLLSRRRRRSTAQAVGLGAAGKELRRRDSDGSSNIDGLSEGEGEDGERSGDSPARHTRSRTAASSSGDLVTSADSTTHPLKRRTITINPQTDDALLRRRKAKALHPHNPSHNSTHSQSKSQILNANLTAEPTDTSSEAYATVAATLKSPSAPGLQQSKQTTRFPNRSHAQPPRPLVPRRQPSYTLTYSPETPKKTLIIDLDETLIHSMAKGGRMSTGHMVEVRLNPSTLGGPPGALASGVPILYYVHERPNCHAFLRKVSKWYNLVVFTASVQEYADPVIDWLERERRYFLGGRLYRQHCTLRNGAYIKDLAQVEPDLSRVVILDNSPMSYIFHEDNAIPIEGWISDPTDNDLLHLIPLLEGLQYVTDVRALLALRQGQAPQA